MDEVTGPRLDVVTLPNGEFMLVFSAMPFLDPDGPLSADWQAARERLLESSGACEVLRFCHPVEMPERTETT